MLITIAELEYKLHLQQDNMKDLLWRHKQIHLEIIRVRDRIAELKKELKYAKEREKNAPGVIETMGG